MEDDASLVNEAVPGCSFENCRISKRKKREQENQSFIENWLNPKKRLNEKHGPHSSSGSISDEVDSESLFQNKKVQTPLFWALEDDDELMVQQLNQPLYIKQLQIPEKKSLIIISTTFQTISENPNTWLAHKSFDLSKKVYLCRIPKDYLARTVFRQTLKFKPLTDLYEFCIKQQLVYRSRIIDKWLFENAPIQTNVINTWETIMKRSPKSYFFMKPDLTGHATLQTQFYDGNHLLNKYKTCVVFK